MKNLVTGGGGFVGRHLCDALRTRGESVRALDLTPGDHPDDVCGDMMDEKVLEAAMAGVDCVFHLAGNAQLWAKDPQAFDHLNFQGTLRVARMAQRLGAERFVHCSSLTTLVGRGTPIGPSQADEASLPALEEMLGPYPMSKRRADEALLAMADRLNVSIAMPTEPMGPGDVQMTPPTKLIVDLVNGKTPATIDCILNFVPVESLARGMIAVRDRGARAERYLLGGENIPMGKLLAALEAMTGRSMPKTQLPYWVALCAGFVDTQIVAPITGKPPTAPLTGVRLAGRRVSFSSQKAQTALGWQAEPFEPALRAMLTWLNEHGAFSDPVSLLV